MRILYVTFDSLDTDYAWTVHVKAVVNGLTRRGHDVRVVAAGRRAPADLAAEFVPIGNGQSRGKRVYHHLAGSLRSIVRAGRSFRPEVLYCRGIHLSLTPVVAARWLGCPYVVEVNGLLEAETRGFLRGPVRMAHRLTLLSSDHVVTVSDRLRSGLCRMYGASSERVSVIANGADPDRFRPGNARQARKQLGLKDRPTLVYAGSFYPHHALDLLPAIVRELSERTRQFQILLVGDGSTRAAVESALRTSGGDSRVTFAGSVAHSRIPQYLAAADAGLYLLRKPHDSFGFSPIKVFEYMATGLPVIAATDLPEIRSFVREQGVGLDAGLEPAGIAEQAARILRNADLRGSMGDQGRQKVEETYNWDRAVDRVEDVLRETHRRRG